MFTNRILPHGISGRPPDSLGTGADSFKRMLGGTTSIVQESSDVMNRGITVGKAAGKAKNGARTEANQKSTRGHRNCEVGGAESYQNEQGREKPSAYAAQNSN